MSCPPLEHIDTDPTIDALLRRQVVDAGVAPAASAGVAWRQEGRWHMRSGCAGSRSVHIHEDISLNTPFDLASLTKPLVAFTVAACVDAGLLGFDTPLMTLLPWTQSTPTGAAAVEALLAHRAGLAPHVELFAPLRAGQALRRSEALYRAACAMRDDWPPSNSAPELPPLYSDLGYLLVGEALSGAAALPLDTLLTRTLRGAGVFGVTSARLAGNLPQLAAATETVPYRGGELVGVVHDDNAWALNGLDCSGHAGLFGDVLSVLAFGRTLIDLHHHRSDILRRGSFERLVAARPGGSLRAGFDSRGSGPSSIGTLMGPNTFGHLGFTGTSFWCDPDYEVVVCLLTNRVCPSRENTRIREARPILHDALVHRARGR